MGMRRDPQEFAVMQVVGANVRKYRQARGLTAWELGEKVGLSGNAIGRYERGEYMPSYTTLARLVMVLHINWASLFQGVEDVING